MVPIRPGYNLLITDRTGRNSIWIGGGAGQPRHVFVYLSRAVIIDSYLAIVRAVVVPHLRWTARVAITGTARAVSRTVGAIGVPDAVRRIFTAMGTVAVMN